MSETKDKPKCKLCGGEVGSAAGVEHYLTDDPDDERTVDFCNLDHFTEWWGKEGKAIFEEGKKK